MAGKRGMIRHISVGKDPETYLVTARCTNCGYTFEVKITKGNTVKGPHECPYCGCISGEFFERGGKTTW